MPILFFDTETTGKLVRGKAAKDEDQPDLVQLAAILTDDDLNEVGSINSIIYPKDWKIPDDAAAIHGIYQDKAEAYGQSLKVVVELFAQMADVADRFVAHNIDFDTVIMRKAYFRAGFDEDPFQGKEQRCTMKAAKPVLKLPNRNSMINDPFKFPKLEECHKHFFDEGIDGAHNALVDVQATIRVYQALCDHYGMKY